MKEIWVKIMNDYKNHTSTEEKIKSKNKKLKAVKNLKVSLKVAQLVAPYAIASGISIGCFELLGQGLPFYRDSFEYHARIMKTFDTLGNESIEKQYHFFGSSTNLIRHYAEPVKEDTGVYTRQIETYEMDENDSEEIEKIMKADIDYDTLNEILDKPSSVSYETKNNPTNEELKAKDYLQAVVYSIDNDDVLIEKESKEKNIGLTILEGLCCLFLGWYIKTDLKERNKPRDEKSLVKEHNNKKLVK